ncbi:MAG: phosphoribosyl-AMP cyclohydrolase [Beijerinckiaceae bacterium]
MWLMFTPSTPFAPPGTKLELEEGGALTPKFDVNGLITAVVTDSASGDVIMLAHMNAEALRRSITTGDAWYYSRSRSKLWRKGETSGHTQKILEMRIDCDQDAVWLKVEQTGPACHTERKGCFYRQVALGSQSPRLLPRDAG